MLIPSFNFEIIFFIFSSKLDDMSSVMDTNQNTTNSSCKNGVCGDLLITKNGGSELMMGAEGAISEAEMVSEPEEEATA